MEKVQAVQPTWTLIARVAILSLCESVLANVTIYRDLVMRTLAIAAFLSDIGKTPSLRAIGGGNVAGINATYT